jgi:hypothetical protein
MIVGARWALKIVARSLWHELQFLGPTYYYFGPFWSSFNLNGCSSNQICGKRTLLSRLTDVGISFFDAKAQISVS